MKKILLSLSALTIGATPAVSLLNVGQKQVITQVTSEIQKKIDETSVLFKAPIITNAQKQNADVTTNWLNDQKVSDISNIDSALSYANFNAEKYDMKSAQKTLNKIYKDKDYKYKNEDATAEMIFGAADKGVSLLENSIDDNGLKAEGVNELLNWISYVSFGTGLAGALNAKSIDKSILNLNKKIEWITAFKNTPAPTLSKLNNEYGVYTFQDLQDFISISIANLLANASGFKGTAIKTRGDRISGGLRPKYEWYNRYIPKNINLKTLKLVVEKSDDLNGGWAEEKDRENPTITDKYSKRDTRTINEHMSDFFRELMLHIIDGQESINLELNSTNVELLMNIIYSLSWYISSYDYFKNDLPADDNHLFSSSRTNMEVFNIQKNKIITKKDIESKGIEGILELLKSLFIEKDKTSSIRVLKILFQADQDITPNKLNFEDKAKLNIIPIINDLGFIGEWTKNTANNGLTLLINNLMVGVVTSKKVNNLIKTQVNIEIPLIGSAADIICVDRTGYLIGNLINSILANNNNESFFIGNNSLTENSLIKSFLPEKIANIIKSLGAKGIYDKTISKAISLKLGTIIKIISSITGSEVNLPEFISSKSMKEILNIGVMGITIGNVIWSGLNFINASLSEIMKPLGLLGAILSDDVSKNYNFYVKDKENKDSIISLEQLLGYKPDEVFKGNTKTSDLAIVWSMMRFVNTEQGKNKVVGVSLKNSNGTSDEIIYGHKAWKMLLGLNYDEMSYYNNSLLYWVNELLTNGLTAKIIQWPIKMTRKYIDYNLSDITFNRNKKMNYWSNKDLFSTQFVSYKEEAKQEVLNYKIMYKVKKDVYYTYNVSVYKENTSSKYKINSFSRI
ncbi:hypothetical protein CG001_00820 [Mesoplasma coleopterae]|uniref:hypothetical protein n=1 Tax=Mesoplasma coleopterae TaxID=324078 RepID=UPI000D02A5B7|nr:hypothetical protein [Mesoplasma coleopterae]AVN62204.1 hypothetical protein CG001_00820 [Mesoplasma coleopterae]